MGLINETAYQYYNVSEKFTAATTGTGQTFTLTFDSLPTSETEFRVYVAGVELDPADYSYASPVVTVSSSITTGQEVRIEFRDRKLGSYRYISIEDIVNNFMVAYVGNGKLIDDVKRSDVIFHCKRGIQEFSYDIHRVEKIQEIELGPSLCMPMPQDYVNYVRLSFVDTAGVENIILPGRFTSKPSEAVAQDSDYEYLFTDDGELLSTDSVTNDRFEDFNIRNLTGSFSQDDYYINQGYATQRAFHLGRRFGLNPETTTRNGFFIIDEDNGKICFSGDLSGNIITLKYVSDGLGTDAEMKVHKFAEEAIYKHIAYNIVSTKLGAPEYIVNRYRKERRAAMRNAKLRLSNIKFSELAQVMRGKSKQIKH